MAKINNDELKIGVTFTNCEKCDRVEVVRCKKCRFCKKHPTSNKTKICTNEQWNTEYHPFVHDNDFCSYGERKDNV